MVYSLEYVEDLVQNEELDEPLRKRIKAGLYLLKLKAHRETIRSSIRRSKSPRRKGQHCLILSWRDPTVHSVSIRGTFTDPPWMNNIQCYRDPKDRLFRADLSNLGLGPGTYL